MCFFFDKILNFNKSNKRGKIEKNLNKKKIYAKSFLSRNNNKNQHIDSCWSLSLMKEKHFAKQMCAMLFQTNKLC